MHYGQDFSLPKGSPVYATADGRISILKSSFGGFGKYIYIDHGNGYKTVYAHLDKFNVRRGQKVKRGELIAYSGNSGRSTAPHLHYEVHKNGKKVNPINFFFNDLTYTSISFFPPGALDIIELCKRANGWPPFGACTCIGLGNRFPPCEAASH